MSDYAHKLTKDEGDFNEVHHIDLFDADACQFGEGRINRRLTNVYELIGKELTKNVPGLPF